MKNLTFLLFAMVFAVVPVPSQDKPGTTKDDEDVVKAGREDPYTKNDPELMAAAGIVGYGPFPWADFKTSADLETVLGEGRILWLETAHFRIGLNLKTMEWPPEQDKRKLLREEIKQVRDRLPKFPAKPSKLTPWVQLHLYAYRLEKLYADVEQLLGVTAADFAGGKLPPNGPFLGLGDKYLVLLFQKKSDLARYFERFCNWQADSSMRWYHSQTHQMLSAIAAESLEGFDATAIHAHVVYNVAHCLFSGYRGFHVALPLWLDEGLAHHFALQVPSDVANVQILDSEATPDLKIGAWPIKVRRRAQHEGVCFTYEQMTAWRKFEDLGYHAHSQAWSRVDFLIKRDSEKLAFLVRKIKEMPPQNGRMVPPEQVAALTQKLLIELFELDPATFDEQWRDYVLKNYPKK